MATQSHHASSQKSGSSSLQNSPMNRRRRKLPLNPKRDVDSCPLNANVFWYSYPSALQWIRSNENVISKCIQLLQLYPNLIQDASLDSLWEFIEPLVLTGQGDHKDDGKNGVGQATLREINGRNQSPVLTSRKGKDIPYISVTESIDTPGPTFTIPSTHARTPRVHLITGSATTTTTTSDNKTQDDNVLYFGALDMLKEDFYVRTANLKQMSRYGVNNVDGKCSKKSRRHYVLAESDVCVYLFNDATLNDEDSFHDLCVALKHKIPVVYLRYHNKELPKFFSDTVLRNSHGCVTLNDYAEKFMKETSVSRQNQNSAMKSGQPNNRLSPLKLKSRPSSANDLHVKGINGRRGKRRHSPVLTEMDLVFSLVSNFKNACVFDETDVSGCSLRLKQSIYDVLGIYETKPEPPTAQRSTSSEGDMSCSEESMSSFESNDNAAAVNTTKGKITTSTITSTNVNGSRNANKNNKKRPVNTDNNSGDSTRKCLNRPTFLRVPDAEDIITAREWGVSGSSSAPPHGLPRRDYDSDGADGRRSSNSSITSSRSQPIFFGSDHAAFTPTSPEQKASTYLVFDRNKTPDGPRRIEFPLRGTESVNMESDLDSDECDITESPIGYYEIDLSREINARGGGTPESDISTTSLF